MIQFDVMHDNLPYVIAETFDRRRVFLYWRYTPVCLSLLEGHVVNIYRKNSETDPEVLIATVPAIQTHYTDSVPNLYDLMRQYFYVLQIDNGEKTPFVPIGQTSSYIIGKLRSNARLQLKYEGAECLVYVRRTVGKRCTKCHYDAYTKEGTQNCSYCYGTGFEGGYYPPVLTQVKIDPPTKTNIPAEVLKEHQQTAGWTSHYPILSARDVILDLNRSRRWVIEALQPGVETVTNIIAQTFTLVSVNPSEIESKLPIVQGLIPFIPALGKPQQYNFDTEEYTHVK